MNFETSILAINTAMIAMSKYSMIVWGEILKIVTFIGLTWAMMIERCIEKVRNVDQVRELENAVVDLKVLADKKAESYNLTRKFNMIQERKVIRKFNKIKADNKEMKLKNVKFANINKKIEDDNRRFCYDLDRADNYIRQLEYDLRNFQQRNNNRRNDNRNNNNRRNDNRRNDNRNRNNQPNQRQHQQKQQVKKVEQVVKKVEQVVQKKVEQKVIRPQQNMYQGGNNNVRYNNGY